MAMLLMMMMSYMASPCPAVAGVHAKSRGQKTPTGLAHGTPGASRDEGGQRCSLHCSPLLILLIIIILLLLLLLLLLHRPRLSLVPISTSS